MGSTSTKRFILVAFAVAILAAPSAVLAQQVSAGYDLFSTCSPPGDTNCTYKTFANPCHIPGAMFGAGCSDFTGTIQFVGEPIASFNGVGDLGSTDTIVRRLNNTNFPNPGGPFPTSSPAIPIELVALSLVSANPITVTGCAGGSQAWDVFAADAPGNALTAGSMTITKTSATGGTFNSILHVCPRLTFTRVSDGTTFQVDACANAACEVHLSTAPTPACWSHTASPGLIVQNSLTSNFFPGHCPSDPNFSGCPGQQPAIQNNYKAIKEMDPNHVPPLWVHTVTPPSPRSSIPTLSEWGMIALAGLLMLIAVYFIRRKSARAPAGA